MVVFTDVLLLFPIFLFEIHFFYIWISAMIRQYASSIVLLLFSLLRVGRLVGSEREGGKNIWCCGVLVLSPFTSPKRSFPFYCCQKENFLGLWYAFYAQGYLSFTALQLHACLFVLGGDFTILFSPSLSLASADHRPLTTLSFNHLRCYRSLVRKFINTK